LVPRKITDGVARIRLGLADSLTLGNLDSRRDWGHAADFVEAMWMMLQQKEPQDFVIATGEQHSIREFLQEAFSYVGLPHWSQYVSSDPRFKRPAELHTLCGNSNRARELLGWQPRSDFRSLVRDMVDADLERLKAGQ
jgi:GDPmannose 4,6-dehydratase